MLSRPLVAVGAVAVLAAIGAWGRRRQQVLQRSRSRGHLLALREALKLRQALQHKLGLDIGGTLAKIVLASEPKDTPEYSPTRYTLPNPRSVTHDKLGFTARSGGFSFAFISTPTETLEETARSIAETVQYPADDEYREIIATGGGAHRFYDTFRDVLQVELQPLKELHAAVDGLLFLAAEGPTEELFTVEAGKERSVDWVATPPLALSRPTSAHPRTAAPPLPSNPARACRCRLGSRSRSSPSSSSTWARASPSCASTVRTISRASAAPRAAVRPFWGWRGLRPVVEAGRLG